MIVVTGGAGFIGSVVVAELNERGRRDVLVVDRLGSGIKWRNLVGLHYIDVLSPEAFLDRFEKTLPWRACEAVIHLGACSSTAEANCDYLLENNYRYTIDLARACRRQGARFIYASSAATYGNGEDFDDDVERLDTLRPINPYGYFKHAVDLWMRRDGFGDRYGIKYFNVFGPNEAHKGFMRSAVAKWFDDYRAAPATFRLKLFKSNDARFADGGQMRDFIYVKDAALATLSFLGADAPAPGIYNVGTGKAHTWVELATAFLDAVGLGADRIDFVDIPPTIANGYQNFTQANVAKLKAHLPKGTWPARSLDNAVHCYATRYLAPDMRVGEVALRSPLA